MKKCIGCEIEKDKLSYGRDIYKIDGLNPYCKQCIKERNRKRTPQQKEKDKECLRKHKIEYREELRQKAFIEYYNNWEKRRECAQRSYYKHRESICAKRAKKSRLESERIKNRERQKEWRNKHPGRFGAVTTEWKKRNPEKAAAHGLVCWSLKAGTLIRNPNCQQCGVGCKTQAHHSDYKKPLEVVWLCLECHGEKHRKYR